MQKPHMMNNLPIKGHHGKDEAVAVMNAPVSRPVDRAIAASALAQLKHPTRQS